MNDKLIQSSERKLYIYIRIVKARKKDVIIIYTTTISSKLLLFWYKLIYSQLSRCTDEEQPLSLKTIIYFYALLLKITSKI